MRHLRLVLSVTWFAAACSVAANAAEVTLGQWTSRRPFRSSPGDTIHYYLFVPKDVDAAEKYPLVIWLHGGVKSNGVGGPNMPTGAFYQDAHQRQQPCFVLRPVAVKGKNWVSPRDAKTSTHTRPATPAPSVTA